MLLLIGEAKYELVFGAAEDFQNMLKNKDSPLYNCVTLSATPLRLGSPNKFSIDIRDFLPKYLKQIAKEQAHIIQKSKGSLDFSFLPLFASLFLE